MDPDIHGEVPHCCPLANRQADVKQKEEHINKFAAFHLGELYCGFASGKIDENLIENTHETNFVTGMDNKRTLGEQSNTDIKYAGVVSGGVGMTMIV